MSLTPEVTRKSALGVSPSPAPFFTPRPERRRLDSNPTRLDKDKEKEVNVQVLLRCRPLSDEEQKSNVPRVISCNEQKKEVTVLHSAANKQVDRFFTFDKVFGPKAQQRAIYDQAIAPIVHEILEGFSCTVFAYGQTGTGKTYTMEGGMRKKGGDLPAEAGVIPRAVRHIFDTLEAQNADYSMKVTFLELYNEEITDLLAPDDNSRLMEDKQKKPISLMEDGKGCVVVRGLEEEVVYSANDIYALLERGAAKRRTADTLLNKRSSRSHSVFTITVHIKEEAVGDEELIKCGKLNLVDLAGSENILRSGSRDGRAREAGEINKSLLTLGRVINALVEHSPHVPYRDSKLTRLLRDSLGGKTKTCIIATISPSAHSLEETLSTLDYAHRAKNIKNKPEANQKFSKAVLLKDLYLEIERMREDVRAARDRNGVYIPQERFVQEEAEKKARIERVEQLENNLDLSERECSKFRDLYLSEQEKLLDTESELKDCKRNLDNSNKELLDLEENYKELVLKLTEREVIISRMKSSEISLIDRAKGLCSELQHASDDITSLFARLDQKDKMESENQNKLLKLGSQLDHNLKDLHRTVLGSISQQQQQLTSMEEHTRSFLARKYDATRVLESKIKKTTDAYTFGVAALKELAETLRKKASSNMEKINSIVVSQTEVVEEFLIASAMEAAKVTQDIWNSLNEQKELLALAAKQQEQGLLQSMRSAQEISSVTSAFLNNIYDQAHEVMEISKASHAEKSRKLSDFEMMFREEAEREEKQALEDISMILSKLTSKKTAMVSEASRNIQEHEIQEKKRLLEQMSEMQKVSVHANKDLSDYVMKAGNHFMENMVSSAESRTVMENYIQECMGRVDESEELLKNTHTGIQNLNAKGLQELKGTTEDAIEADKSLHDEFSSGFSSMDTYLVARTDELQKTVKESLMEDCENKEISDTMTETCMKQIVSLQENHGEGISNIRNIAEQSLIKDYLVDQNKKETPKRRVITVPSLASIEDMRSSFSKNLNEDYNVSEKISTKMGQEGGANRTPFLEVN
ncbi:PREDICTED: kinesin-like protein KIN-5B [Tarenaya hassleriana]|uniref:kinesin-like protein KIN-5B n=1 Tax=Tarenaya hassleriana TaxID=28532 RepID=UPI00053C45DC|nr:PREDICTED: kinesin-like protein KIN-5B [Tarenaya hassleriana]XP_010529862.1 PREDICTED: kinesin-like protein KIN-5B [Tarenaya hassleriana]